MTNPLTSAFRTVLVSIGAAVVVVGAVAWSFYAPVIQSRADLIERRLRTEARIDRQQRANDELRAAITRAKNDPRHVESLAREHLRFARRDEVVFVFESVSAN